MKLRSGHTPRRFTRAALAVTALLWAGASVQAADFAPSTSEILIERLLIRVVSDAKLAYQIEAGMGRMNEDTREIEMSRPNVNIYGEGEQVKQSVRSTLGRMWPVTITVTEKDGKEKEVSKFDWSLTGNVAFESAEGYRVKSEELNFSSAQRNITSQRGVEYRMPTGRGTILSGKANQFEARVDPDSGQMTGWTLGGGVELSADPENPPTEAAGEAKDGKDADGKLMKKDKDSKKKKSLDERVKEELKDQKSKFDVRTKKK